MQTRILVFLLYIILPIDYKNLSLRILHETTIMKPRLNTLFDSNASI